jgi:hypothetical protein
MKKIGPRGKITSFVMKVALLQFFLILSFTVIGLANESTGQGILDKKISVVIKEENFKSALRKLSQEAGIRFSYTRNTIPEKEKVSVSAQNETLANIFNALFKPYNIRFEAVGSQVILKKTASGSFQGSVMKVDLDFNFAFPFRPIRGTVKDAQGKPIADASITIKGTRRGTSTDVNGEFSIDVQDTASVLVISAVGYQTTEVTVQQESSLSIVLVEAVNKLDEVVVVGYGTQKAINLTGAVGTVSSKVLESRPLVNLGQGLQGTIPGLNVNLCNGAPGQGARSTPGTG